MLRLDSLNFMKGKKPKKRVGRGLGTGLGTTCGRGMKGAGSRSGYKTRLGYEGGNIPFFRRFPKKGFSRKRFAKRLDVINLDRISQLYNDGEEVSLDTLFDKGFISGVSFGIKVLGRGEITKKVTIHASEFSESAISKLSVAGIDFKEI